MKIFPDDAYAMIIFMCMTTMLFLPPSEIIIRGQEFHCGCFGFFAK